MTKYQKALDNIVINSCPIAIRSKEPCSSCISNRICNALAKDWVDTLQELIDKETLMKPEALEQAKKEHELLELYKKFVKTMQVDILIEEVYQYNEYLGKREYLDIGGATDESIELLKKIKELEEEYSE